LNIIVITILNFVTTHALYLYIYIYKEPLITFRVFKIGNL
jgi:hypothetical protein